LHYLPVRLFSACLFQFFVDKPYFDFIVVAKTNYSNSKSKRYLCWQRRRLPQRICKERFETVPYAPPPCRLDIIFDLEMELHILAFLPQ